MRKMAGAYLQLVVFGLEQEWLELEGAGVFYSVKEMIVRLIY